MKKKIDFTKDVDRERTKLLLEQIIGIMATQEGVSEWETMGDIMNCVYDRIQSFNSIEISELIAIMLTKIFQIGQGRALFDSVAVPMAMKGLMSGMNLTDIIEKAMEAFKEMQEDEDSYDEE